tara:strand:+ start:245 stop:1015 length:771 start_codon:yes stop_codon:yes gene_type:complete
MSKKDLIKEELKRHMQLLEYTFYMEEPKDDDTNLLLGALDTLNEQDPTETDETGEAGGGDPFAVETGETGETGETEGGDDPFAGETEETEGGDDPFADEGGETGETDPFADEGGAEIEDEVADEGTVEVDVTDIVDKAEQTRSDIESMTSKMDELLGKLSDLEGKVGDMDKVIDKIDGLEKEIEERNPTPVEKLEMRSMDSFPYSISLTDYWTDKEGYDVGSKKDEEDYVITQDDVDSYSVDEIKDSFDYNKTDED